LLEDYKHKKYRIGAATFITKVAMDSQYKNKFQFWQFFNEKCPQMYSEKVFKINKINTNYDKNDKK
jgi:hypothetical protein